MKILFLNVRYRTDEYQSFAPNILGKETISSGNVVCKKNAPNSAFYHSIESNFSFSTEYFDKFIEENNVEFLDDFPDKNEKYIILYNLSDIISFATEIEYWDEWYNKKDKVFLRMIDDLRNNRCSIIFRSLHDAPEDNSEKSRDFVMKWLNKNDISYNRISFLGSGVYSNWWREISAFRVNTICLQLYQLFKGYTPNYFLGAFVNNIYHLRQKHFITFNHHWKGGYRTKLVKFLSDNDYIKKGYVSYKASESSSAPNESLKRIYLDSSEKTHKELRGDISRHDDKWIDNCSKELIDKNNNTSLYDLIRSTHSGVRSNSPLHFNSYFNIIVNYITSENPHDMGIDLDEKIFKSIIHLQPFVVMGSQGILTRLRKHGFKTFTPYIDESYDKEKGADKRMDMVLNEVDKLCSMEREEIDKWYWEMKDTLIHNFNHFSKFCNGQIKIVLDEVKQKWESNL
jgi:hypothetical protein